MHVLVAPDKFKGSLTAAEVASHVAAGLRRAAGDGLAIACVPVADGGDGTLDAAIVAGFERVPARARWPTAEPFDAAYARRGELAVVELASVCGLELLPGGRREPLRASSYGMGEVIGAALDAGCERIVLGVGGSASSDGGAGLLEALGARVYDRAGAPLPRGGGALRRAARWICQACTRRRPHRVHRGPDVDPTRSTAAAARRPFTGPRRASATRRRRAGRGPAPVGSGGHGRGRTGRASPGPRRGRGRGPCGARGPRRRGCAPASSSCRAGHFAGRCAAADLVIIGEGSLDDDPAEGPPAIAAAARPRQARVALASTG